MPTRRSVSKIIKAFNDKKAPAKRRRTLIRPPVVKHKNGPSSEKANKWGQSKIIIASLLRGTGGFILL